MHKWNIPYRLRLIEIRAWVLDLRMSEDTRDHVYPEHVSSIWDDDTHGRFFFPSSSWKSRWCLPRSSRRFGHLEDILYSKLIRITDGGITRILVEHVTKNLESSPLNIERVPLENMRN